MTDGRTVKIISTESGNKQYPIVAMVPFRISSESTDANPILFSREGFSKTVGFNGSLQLVNIPQKKFFGAYTIQNSICINSTVLCDTKREAEEQLEYWLKNSPNSKSLGIFETEIV